MSEQLMPLTYESVLALIQKNAQEAAQELKDSRQEFKQWMKDFSEEFNKQRQEAALRSEKLEWQMEKTDKQIERTGKEVSTLGSRVGEIIENMVGGDIIEQFQELGYAVTAYSRRKIFGIKGKIGSGEIDLFLENGDVAILVEARTTLKIDDVKEHIEKLEKYRHHVEANGNTDKRKFIGAVATGSAAENVIKFAHRQGLYVIVQAGRTVEILPPPAGFVAKKW